jgi:hypothetical protein
MDPNLVKKVSNSIHPIFPGSCIGNMLIIVNEWPYRDLGHYSVQARLVYSYEFK